jgi:GNAT superfamily N-acetyltransferase
MIRAATIEDVPVIGELIRALADYEQLADEAIFTNEDLSRALFGEHPYAEVLLAEHDGAIVGFALFFHNFSTFLARPGIYLEDLFVRPERRGHGHGRALLAEIARIALARGCGRVEWSVLDWNAPSIAFYRSLGARAMDDWTVYRLTGAPLAALAQNGD